MNIILNIALLILSISWFSKVLNSEPRKSILPVILSFIGGNILVFVISFMIQQEYLDGFLYIVSGGINLLVFWLWTSVSIIQKHVKMKTTHHIINDLAQNSILLVFILVLFLLFSGASLKIGG